MVALGVNVYLMQRTPKKGAYTSPWAVKKVARRFVNDRCQDINQRLLAEAEILKNLSHPNIVGFRTLTKAMDGAWCLAMEKAESCLMDLIEQRLDTDAGPFPPNQVKCVGLGISKALDYLHSEKLLMHGDIKSGNVLVFGDFKVAKLCDFGVTLPLTEPNGRVKHGHYYVGTQAWSAPEIIRMDESLGDSGDLITCKADIFSYGLTVWEMLSLCLPHGDLLDCTEDDDMEAMEQREADYQEALGTRPPLPALPRRSDYATAVAVFITTTEESPSKRPKACEVMEIWDS